MKDNIVFWGANENDQKILVVLRLLASDKKVKIWTFLKNGLSPDFVEQIFADWDDIDTTTFPESNTFEERDVTENDLLPENIKADSTEIVIRAEQEWRVKVLSMRLFEMMSNEINSLYDEVNDIVEYDRTLWDTAKGYSEKLNLHNNERNITRNQFGELRVTLNHCFTKLKSLMESENEKFNTEAKENKDKVLAKLKEIEEKTKSGKNVGGLFNELKKLQTDIKNIRLSRDGRRKIWDMMNVQFGILKEKRNQGAGSRLEKRIAGLQSAIDKMEQSVKYDRDSVKFQNEKANNVNVGKLEMQLREAKAKMIETRIASKQEKLDDMHETINKLKKDLAKVENAKSAKAAKSEGKKPNNKKATESKKTAESKIAAEKPVEAKPTEPKVEAEKPTEPKAEVEKPAEPKAEVEKPAEPKAEVEKPAEPKAEVEKPAEPKAEVEKPAEPKVEAEKPTEPKVEAEKPTEPKMEAEKPAEPEVKEQVVEKSEEKPVTNQENSNPIIEKSAQDLAGTAPVDPVTSEATKTIIEEES